MGLISCSSLLKTLILRTHQGKHCWDRGPSVSFLTLMIVPIYSNLENNFSAVSALTSAVVLIAQDAGSIGVSEMHAPGSAHCVTF